MKPLEDELRDALRREDPPDGFAERVLARADAQPLRADRSERRTTSARGWIVGWAAAAAIVVAVVGGGMQYRAAEKAREERERGEAAKAQVVQALRLAGYKLHVVQEKIKEIGS